MKEVNNTTTKKCKYCQTDIPKKARVCPNCKKKQKGNGCLTAFIILMVFFGLCGVFSGNNSSSEKDLHKEGSEDTSEQQTLSDNTANPAKDKVKLYENKDELISFEYPSNWVISNSNTDDECIVMIDAPDKSENGNIEASIWILKHNLDSTNAEFNELYSINVDEIKEIMEEIDSTYHISNVEKVTLNGANAIYTRGSAENGEVMEDVYIYYNNGAIYYFALLCRTDKNSKYQPVFDSVKKSYTISPKDVSSSKDTYNIKTSVELTKEDAENLFNDWIDNQAEDFSATFTREEDNIKEYGKLYQFDLTLADGGSVVCYVSAANGEILVGGDTIPFTPIDTWVSDYINELESYADYENYIDENFDWVEKPVIRKKYGVRYIEGIVINKSIKTIGYADISFNLYDSSGNQIDTAFDTISNLPPGNTWKFSAVVSDLETNGFTFAGIRY